MTQALVHGSVAMGDLEAALTQAWGRETSADSKRWTEANPAWGQCAVTALVVQDLFGGEVVRGEVGLTSHYWNVLPSGAEVDLTKHQFAAPVEVANAESRTREYLLSNPETAERYETLKRAVSRYLHRHG